MGGWGNRMSGIIIKMKMSQEDTGKMYLRNIELEKIVKKLGDACDKVLRQRHLIQPFLSIWKEHGKLIEECRNN